MRAALFIQLNCFETIRITKDFHECFAGKLLFASPKKTLALLQLNLELNHINTCSGVVQNTHYCLPAVR